MILVLRQIEAGIVGISCGIFATSLVPSQKHDTTRKIIRYLLFFALSFLTASLRDFHINVLVIRLITLLEMILAEKVLSGKKLFEIFIEIISLYTGFNYIFWICSIPFGTLSYYFFRGIPDDGYPYLITMFFEILLFIVSVYLLNEARVKRIVQRIFDNAVCKIVILNVFSVVLLFSIALAVLNDYGEQTRGERNLTAVLVLTLLAMLAFVLYFILQMLAELRQRSLAIQKQKQTIFESSERLTEAERETEDLITEVHRMRKNVSAATSFARLLRDSDSAKLPDEIFGFAGNLVSMEYDMNDAAQAELRRMFIPASSGIPLLDALFTDYLEFSKQNGIQFFAVCHAPFNPLTETGILRLNDLHRIFADLLENAVKAVSAADTPKRISVYMGVNQNGFFEADFYDSGVPFPEGVLQKLGARGNTTNGTGNGLPDILEILRQCGGSFRIESGSLPSGYQKVIKVIFDGKTEVTYNKANITIINS